MSRKPHNVPPKRKNRPTKVALREMAKIRLFVDNFQLDGIRKDWFQSIVGFIRRMQTPDVVAAMQMALAKRGNSSRDYAFRYFCGVCWGKIKEAA